MIRKMRKKDIENVLVIWYDTNCAAHSYVPSSYWKSHLEEVKTGLLEATCYVYEEKGEIAGFIGLLDTYIAGLFVKETKQGKGIGKMLLEKAKERTEELTLHVYQKNQKAILFYEKAGFTLVHTQIEQDTGEVESYMKWQKKW